MLPPLLNAPESKCKDTAYRPVMDAIDLLKRYLDQPIAKEGAFLDEAEKIPLGGVVREEWRKAAAGYELPPRPRRRHGHGARPPHRTRGGKRAVGCGRCGRVGILKTRPPGVAPGVKHRAGEGLAMG
ncbi:hypothetical protein [Streptomyces milbemycinicus]|uniref:Uncharacterized protein n=1 Tax=Streptomyces milbemycinicus TaxID=476552 RepID=A0ABW8M036_9ACTN